MTITLQAVNELIASLESAGELSIKETKVMALAKAFKQLAAENVGLKAGRKFFMYSDDAGFETYQTREEAIKAAEEMIDDYRGDAGDGWPEEAGTTRWGVIIQQATECDYEKPSAENGWLGWCDYRLLPETPVTDRIVAGIKADGVEEEPFGFVSRSGDLVVIELNGDQHIRDGMPVFVKALREGAK
ncbi:hypothetical protein [Escherichia coli]|uniref:hypothetical protein n=1 Tax=Escherichia coli TaxID=562 RepID=UPI003312F871